MMKHPVIATALTLLLTSGTAALAHAGGKHITAETEAHRIDLELELEDEQLFSGTTAPLVIRLYDLNTSLPVSFDQVSLEMISPNQQILFQGVLSEDDFLVGGGTATLHFPQAGTYELHATFFAGRGGEAEVIATTQETSALRFSAAQAHEEADTEDPGGTHAGLMMTALLLIAAAAMYIKQRK